MKTCIICFGPAGSHEHIFPAVLGGRRTNKGIYCSDHNQQLGPLAKVLSDQMRAINALLGVHPDHTDGPTRLIVKNPVDGHEYAVTTQKIERVQPHILEDVSLPDGSHQVKAAFSSEQQMQNWLAAQRAAGKGAYVMGPRIEGFTVFAEPYHMRLALGGPDGLRAVAYVALTFLAHHFPDIARQSRLGSFKDYVLGATTAQQPIWWDFDPPSGDLPAQQFRFGHRVVIGLSASRQEAYARVSFFSTLDFSAVFGSVSVEQDKTVIIDIDPLADRPPNDIHETSCGVALAPLAKPVSLTAGLANDIPQGGTEGRFRTLLDGISSWQLDQAVDALLPQVNAARSLNAPMRQERIRELLTDQQQRVFNLISYAVKEFKTQLRTDPRLAAIALSLDAIIASDPSSSTGVTQRASSALELGLGALTAHICGMLDAGELDLLQLRALLGEGGGAAIAARPTLECWVANLVACVKAR